MLSKRLLVAALAGAVAACTAASAAAGSAPAGRAPDSHTQTIAVTIQAGDRIVEPNFALAAGVPVRVTVTNFTHEFHTFTIPGLKLSALILPMLGHTPRTTTVTFTPAAVGVFSWHCLICPSGAHGQRHAMEGKLYLIVDPSTVA